MILQWLPDGCQLVSSPVLPSVYDQTQVKNDEELFPSLSFKLLLMGGEWSHDSPWQLCALCTPNENKQATGFCLTFGKNEQINKWKGEKWK